CVLVVVEHGWRAPNSCARGVCGLPAVARQGPVRFGHLVYVLATLLRGTETVGGVQDLVHEPLGHRLLAAHARVVHQPTKGEGGLPSGAHLEDRKSTRLNSSHVSISYAVFCLKKKKIIYNNLCILFSALYIFSIYTHIA